MLTNMHDTVVCIDGFTFQISAIVLETIVYDSELCKDLYLALKAVLTARTVLEREIEQ